MRALPKCYAATLGGCGGRRDSEEHPLTESLLLRLGELEVEAPWMRGGRKHVTPATMTARVLCEVHNGKLSPYDSEICKLFDALLASQRKQLATWVTINGNHIERWALKVLFADLASAKIFHLDGTRPPKTHPDTDWLRILFDDQPMPSLCGLYYSEKPFRQTEPYAVLATFNNFTPEHDRFPETLYGMSVHLLGFNFTLALRPLDATHNLIYRPLGFSSWGSETAGIRMAWSDSVTGRQGAR
jgi:hypothetical protein